MLPPARKPGMTSNHGEWAVTHPVVVVSVEGQKFWALLKSDASHSTFVKLIKARPKAAGLHQIAMLTGVTTKTLQEFNITMQVMADNFQLNFSVTKIDSQKLLLLENRRYEKVLTEHPHLRGVHQNFGMVMLPLKGFCLNNVNQLHCGLLLCKQTFLTLLSTMNFHQSRESYTLSDLKKLQRKN